MDVYFKQPDVFGKQAASTVFPHVEFLDFIFFHCQESALEILQFADTTFPTEPERPCETWSKPRLI